MPDLGAYSIDDDVTWYLEVTNQSGTPIAITNAEITLRAQDNSIVDTISGTAMTSESTGRARFVWTVPSSVLSRLGETIRGQYVYDRGGSTRQAPADTIRISRERLIQVLRLA